MLSHFVSFRVLKDFLKLSKHYRIINSARMDQINYIFITLPSGLYIYVATSRKYNLVKYINNKFANNFFDFNLISTFNIIYYLCTFLKNKLGAKGKKGGKGGGEGQRGGWEGRRGAVIFINFTF